MADRGRHSRQNSAGGVTHPAPHIAVDARMATDGGIGTYLQGLIPRLAEARREWKFTALGNPHELRSVGWHEHPNVAIRDARAHIFSAAEQLELPLRCPSNATVFWAPHYNVPVLMRRRPILVTIHDVNHLALPELMGSPLRRSYARWMLERAYRTAAHVLFDTRFSRSEAERLLGAPHQRATVVHLGVSESWRNARDAAPDAPVAGPYFVYVGNFKRHKNVPLLLRAFARVRDRIPHRLVLIGRREGLRADPGVQAELDRLGDRALYAGEVGRRELRRYVAHAAALVTASRYEGFGLPPLEAMSAGCPCLVSRAGSLPEVCGDAALYCDPDDEASVAEGLVRIATDPQLRASLVERGRARSAEFTWERTTAATLAVLDRLARP
jgi:glycosyltransferase involved in cell wall biosynthesis